MTKTTRQEVVRCTHCGSQANTFLIESSNSSIRDNLARFNRKSKRYSKSREPLSLLLFFNRHLLINNI